MSIQLKEYSGGFSFNSNILNKKRNFKSTKEEFTWIFHYKQNLEIYFSTDTQFHNPFKATSQLN